MLALFMEIDTACYPLQDAVQGTCTYKLPYKLLQASASHNTLYAGSQG